MLDYLSEYLDKIKEMGLDEALLVEKIKNKIDNSIIEVDEVVDEVGFFEEIITSVYTLYKELKERLGFF
jgi:hypothetical protein